MMVNNNNQIIVEALIKEKQEVMESAKTKADYLEELISKYKVPIITKSEAIPSIQSNIEELEVKKVAIPVTKRKYAKREGSISYEDLRNKVVNMYDDKLSYPQKILYCLDMGINTNTTITNYVLANQKISIGFDKTNDKVKFYTLQMMRKGIIIKTGDKNGTFSLVKTK